MDLLKNEKLLTLIAGIKSCMAFDDKHVFCCSEAEIHKITDKLISQGYLIETTSQHFALPSKDRSFELTDSGKEKYKDIMNDA